MACAWNKLQLAVHCLVQAGSQRDRLTIAIAEHLICLRPKDLPAASRTKFTGMIDRLCLGRVQELNASVQRMVNAIDDHEVDVMVASILHMYEEVTRYQPILKTTKTP